MCMPRLLTSAMLLACAVTTAPAAFAQLPGRGEAVTVTRANGFEVNGSVVSMNDREIRFRSSRGAMMTFQGRDLRNVKTATDTFTWDAKQKKWISARAVAEEAQRRANIAAEEAERRANVAAAKAGPQKLKGTWCGFLRHLPARTTNKDPGVYHYLTLLYIDKFSETGATGVLLIPEENFKAAASIVCKPLSDKVRQKDVVKFFDVECSLDANVPLPAGSVSQKRFPLGLAFESHDGLLPKGLTLDIKTVRPEDHQAKNLAYTGLVLTRQEDIQSGTPATALPLTLADANLKFQQGTYQRTTEQIYKTDKIVGYDPDFLGPGFHPVYESKWRTVTEDQYVPHVRFVGKIKNTSNQAYDVKLVCLFMVDNETLITGNVPHRAVVTVRVPAGKTSVFADGAKLINRAELMWQGAGLLGTLVLGANALTSQGDKNWHVAHVTWVTAAIVSATPVKKQEVTGSAKSPAPTRPRPAKKK